VADPVSCGVAECLQRPWVKLPHPQIDLAQGQKTAEAARFGRRKRPGPTVLPVRPEAPRGIATSTRFRIRFEKGPEMRFISHLDLMRTWERTLRRSELPLAFSQGHHPHIKMSFGPPLPLGHRSRAECFDLELTRPPGVDLAERLNTVLPDGLRVEAYRPILFKIPSLMSQLGGASYRVRFPARTLAEAGLDPATSTAMLARGGSDLLGREHLLVRRKNEEQAREFDARPSIVTLEAGTEDSSPVLDAHIRFIPRAMVRPEEVVALILPTVDVRALDVERTALWMEVGEHRLDPLALLSVRTSG